MHTPRFPLPSDNAPTGWCFDSGVEALVYIESTTVQGKPQMNINAWPRRVWEQARFTFEGLRTMPRVSPNIHEALVRDARWR